MNNCHSFVRNKLADEEEEERTSFSLDVICLLYRAFKRKKLDNEIWHLFLSSSFFFHEKKRILTFLLGLFSCFQSFLVDFFLFPLIQKFLSKCFIKIYIYIVISRSEEEEGEKKWERNKTVSLLIDYLTWLLKHVLLRRLREREKSSVIIISNRKIFPSLFWSVSAILICKISFLVYILISFHFHFIAQIHKHFVLMICLVYISCWQSQTLPKKRKKAKRIDD